MPGQAIFVNGIPAAGKSAVAAEMRRIDRNLRVVRGDDIVKKVPYHLRPSRGLQIWQEILQAVDRQQQRGDVVLDFAMDADQVLEASTRFFGASTFVLLRIDEEVRARRQAMRDRRGQRLGFVWRHDWHAKPGGDDLYEMVLDARGPQAGGLSAAVCARRIIDLVKGDQLSGLSEPQ